jgi:hypothetical protein
MEIELQGNYTRDVMICVLLGLVAAALSRILIELFF